MDAVGELGWIDVDVDVDVDVYVDNNFFIKCLNNGIASCFNLYFGVSISSSNHLDYHLGLVSVVPIEAAATLGFVLPNPH